MQIDMETPPPVAEFPDGLRLQPFDPDTQAHAIFDASEDAFRDHYGHIEKADRGDDAFDRWWHNITHGGNYDPSLFFVVVDGDEIAGMALCLSSQPAKPDTAYVSILGVRRPWRGRGLAKALLYHSFGEFYQRGTFKVALGVDAENLMGATKLYEKVGMRVVKESFLYSKCLREGVNLVKESLD
jgi:ribosomal protein S18 acetylase RimI-like enzyme